MTMPALALVGASGRIQYCTEPFRTRCERTGSLCEELPELEAILSGAADRTVATLSGFETQVESVTDATGSRCALLTLAVESEAQQSAESPILREPLDESPALVWLKDLEGRYTRVNSQFVALLGGSEAQLQGHTDGELPPAATVDGPRLQDAERTAAEPVEFGYTVPAYQDRPALSVLRFLIHGADGQPVGICGVAAPMAHSEIAENEAGRLMQLNRSTGLDPESIRSEILEEWGVSFGESFGPATGGHEEEWEAAPDPGGEVEEAEVAQYEVRQHLPAAPGPDPHWEAELAAVTAARDEAMSARAALEERLRALEEQLAQAEQVPRAVEQFADDDVAEAIAAARSEAEAARAGVDQARAEADAARSVALTAQAEMEAARGETEAVRAEAEAARAQIAAGQDEIASLRAAADAARTEAAAARTEAAAAWTEAENERTNAGLFASQLADARRQLQHQRAQAALAQQQLQIPRCSAAAQASRPPQSGRRTESGPQIPLRARKPVAQPLDPTLMSQPAPASVGGGSSQHEGAQRAGLLGRLRPRGRH